MRRTRLVLILFACGGAAAIAGTPEPDPRLADFREALFSGAGSAVRDAIEFLEDDDIEAERDAGLHAAVSRAFSRYVREFERMGPSFGAAGPASIRWAISASALLPKAAVPEAEQVLFALLECVGQHGSLLGKTVESDLEELARRVRQAVDRVLSPGADPSTAREEHLGRTEVFLAEIDRLVVKKHHGAVALALAAQMLRVVEAIGEGPLPPEIPTERLARIAAAASATAAGIANASKTAEDACIGIQRFGAKLLETVVERGSAPLETLETLLGSYRKILAVPQRDSAEIAVRAAAVTEKLLEAKGASAGLLFIQAGLRESIAVHVSAESDREPRDRKLLKAATEAWVEALDSYEGAYKAADEKSAGTMASAYNECLWQVQYRTGGKDKREPVMIGHKTGDGGVSLMIPRSSIWRIARLKVVSSSQQVFDCWKHDRKEATFLSVSVWRHRWDTNYVAEDGSVIGGDNIGGLARREEDGLKDVFVDIKSRRPLRRTPLNRYIPKAQMLAISGLTNLNFPFEFRAFFFKSTDHAATYCVAVLAPLDLFEERPWEIQSILDSIRIVE